MKPRGAILLALLSVLAGMTACDSEPAPTPTATLTTDSSGTTLVSYKDEEFGISGVVPCDWDKRAPGQFHRGEPGTDPTFLAQVTLSADGFDQLTASTGLPPETGRIQTPELAWHLHTQKYEIPETDTIVMHQAIAESGDTVYLIVLAALIDEHESPYDSVFLPALDALAPAGGSGAAAKHEVTPTATGWPTGRSESVDTRVRSADGMTMVYVPAGEFQMGSDGIRWVWAGSIRDSNLGLQVFTDEQPRHVVYLDGFWIDQTPVTAGMFRAFVEATGYVTAAEREGYGQPYRAGPKESEWPRVPGADWQHPRGPGSQAESDHPVVQVTWDDADAYCRWAGGTLPTKAQWEKACRGTDLRTYPWGDVFDRRGLNYCDCRCPVERLNDPAYDDGYAYTSPVGSYPLGASQYGVLDMVGNVWEWVNDRYSADYYGSSPYRKPPGPETGAERSQRGGAWIDGAATGWTTCTVRHHTPPNNRCDDLGFRCVIPGGKDSP